MFIKEILIPAADLHSKQARQQAMINPFIKSDLDFTKTNIETEHIHYHSKNRHSSVRFPISGKPFQPDASEPVLPAQQENKCRQNCHKHSPQRV